MELESEEAAHAVSPLVLLQKERYIREHYVGRAMADSESSHGVPAWQGPDFHIFSSSQFLRCSVASTTAQY